MGKLKTYAEYRLHENMREYDFYFRKFKALIFNKFQFQNLPCGISEKYVKETLFYYGFGIFYINKYGFLQFTQANAIGLNDYKEPIGFHTVNVNNNGEYVKLDDCIPMYNNELRLSSVEDVHYFAKKLSNIDKTIENNREQMKKSIIIECAEGQKKTIEDIIRQQQDCYPYIIVEKDFSNFNATLNLFKTDATNYCLDLEKEKHEIMAMALTHFGINNVNIDKKERLITDEVNANNEEITLSNDTMLDERISAIDKVNKKFGTDIKILCKGVGANVTSDNDSL